MESRESTVGDDYIHVYIYTGKYHEFVAVVLLRVPKATNEGCVSDIALY